jgi:Ser/Thr protein kinase RdoA (MazF antagonist)
MNDTYLVLSGGVQYILRAYRHGHRTLPQIEHELELLRFLNGRGVNVAAPVPRKDGQFITEVQAPEGVRYVTMFTYAPGEFRPLTVEIAGKYGLAAAKLHRTMGLFPMDHDRDAIDSQYLLDNSVPSILPLLSHRPADLELVVRMRAFLKRQINEMAPTLTWGLCHGDLNGGNCHIDDEGKLTFFDFDCEGPGWLAYDVAVFNWSIRDMPNRDSALQLWHAYIDAYQSEAPLSDSDVAAIPYFVAARQLWLVGLHCRHADEWTYGYLNDAYFTRRFRNVRELVEEQGWNI